MRRRDKKLTITAIDEVEPGQFNLLQTRVLDYQASSDDFQPLDELRIKFVRDGQVAVERRTLSILQVPTALVCTGKVRRKREGD